MTRIGLYAKKITDYNKYKEKYCIDLNFIK